MLNSYFSFCGINFNLLLLYCVVVVVFVVVGVIVDAAHSRRTFVVRTNNNQQQQKYDRSITTFNPNGRLLQVEYSIEATKRGDISIACGIFNNVLCVAITKSCNNTAYSTASHNNYISNNIIHRITDNIFICTVGIHGDSQWIINYIRNNVCMNYKSIYGENCTIKDIAQYISQNIQHELTKTSGARPLGCTCIIFGFDNSNNPKPQLYRVNPGGTIENCWYCSAGKQNEQILQSLQKRYKKCNKNTDVQTRSKKRQRQQQESQVSELKHFINVGNDDNDISNINNNNDIDDYILVSKSENERVDNEQQLVDEEEEQQQQQKEQHYHESSNDNNNNNKNSSDKISDLVRTVITTLIGSLRDVLGNNIDNTNNNDLSMIDRLLKNDDIHNNNNIHEYIVKEEENDTSISSGESLSSSFVSLPSSSSITDLWIFQHDIKRRGHINPICFTNINENDVSCLHLLSKYF